MGLFGFVRRITFVLGETAASIASKSHCQLLVDVRGHEDRYRVQDLDGIPVVVVRRENDRLVASPQHPGEGEERRVHSAVRRQHLALGVGGDPLAGQLHGHCRSELVATPDVDVGVVSRYL